MVWNVCDCFALRTDSYVFLLSRLDAMDSDLYDEFGNYIGPDLESDDDDDQSVYGQADQQDDLEV